MKNQQRFLVFSLFILFMAGACVNKNQSSNSNQGSNAQRAGSFSEKDIFGKETITLNDYQSKVVILNFFATWCPPCKEETPTLIKLYERYKSKLIIIGVSIYSGLDATKVFYNEYKINYPVFMGSFDLMDLYGRVSAIPTSFIIDKKGLIADKITGIRTIVQYEELIKPLLNE